MIVNHIFLISPPFYSHFTPLLSLAMGFKRAGKEVTLGCSKEFKNQVEKEGIQFYEIDISKNKNVGKAEETDQPDSERARLEEFFESTRKGAVETLITQSQHRKKDMLHKPEELIEKIKKIGETVDVDLYVVDILSYGVTLGLYSLNLPFITFCPPHPNTIPAPGDYYGIPKKWPSAIPVDTAKLEKLKEVSRNTQTEFTSIFNELIEESGSSREPIDNAFNLVSPHAVIYNYFNFDSIPTIDEGHNKIFMGHCFEEERLSNDWLGKVSGTQEKILITLGTFLSNRVDILKKLIVACQRYNSEALLIVSAGSNAEKLKKYQSDSVMIESFIPQKALMPYIDTVIFHGGCNTFTEAMFYAKPMVILPFSSDQFNIAYDAERKKLAQVLNPNIFEEDDLVKALEIIKKQSNEELLYWSNISKQRGPDYAVQSILNQLK